MMTISLQLEKEREKQEGTRVYPVLADVSIASQ